MTARGHFLYNFLQKWLKCDMWLLWVISFTIPYKSNWNMTPDWHGQLPVHSLIKIIEIWRRTAMSHLLYSSSSKSMKCDTWLLVAISFTIPYQNHWNMTYDCYVPFPLQSVIKIIEIWPMTAMGNFLYNSLTKSLKYDTWLLGTIFMIYIRNCP